MATVQAAVRRTCFAKWGPLDPWHVWKDRVLHGHTSHTCRGGHYSYQPHRCACGVHPPENTQ